MHKPDQPQTTNTATSRDAAAQIGVESKAVKKTDAIWRGALEECGNGHCAGYMLAMCLQRLTSSDKTERAVAKAEVRRLVKLGKGE